MDFDRTREPSLIEELDLKTLVVSARRTDEGLMTAKTLETSALTKMVQQQNFAVRILAERSLLAERITRKCDPVTQLLSVGNKLESCPIGFLQVAVELCALGDLNAATIKVSSRTKGVSSQSRTWFSR